LGFLRAMKTWWSQLWEKTWLEFLTLLGTLILWLLMRSLRWRRIGRAGDPALWYGEKPIIAAFWHGRQLMMAHIYRSNCPAGDRRPIYVLISTHRDGRLIARAMHYLGLESIAGSSTRGSKQALLSLIRKMRADSHGAVTPDGPRGPACIVKPGVLKIAQKTGCLIVPMAWSSLRKWTLKSWDGMIVPKPFSPAVMMCGEPLCVPAECSERELEELRLELEIRISAVTRQCDDYKYR